MIRRLKRMTKVGPRRRRKRQWRVVWGEPIHFIYVSDYALRRVDLLGSQIWPPSSS